MLTEKFQNSKVASHYADRTSNKSQVVQFYTETTVCIVLPLWYQFISLHRVSIKLAARALLLVDQQLTSQQKPLGSIDQT